MRTVMSTLVACSLALGAAVFVARTGSAEESEAQAALIIVYYGCSGDDSYIGEEMLITGSPFRTDYGIVANSFRPPSEGLDIGTFCEDEAAEVQDVIDDLPGCRISPVEIDHSRRALHAVCEGSERRLLYLAGTVERLVHASKQPV